MTDAPPPTATIVLVGPAVTAASASSLAEAAAAFASVGEPVLHAVGDERVCEVRCTGPGPQQLREALAAQLSALPAGVSGGVVPDRLGRGRRLLVVFDVDSTFIEQEVIELLAAHAGREAEVAAVTDAAMRGELDFAESLRGRVEALGGLPDEVFTAVGRSVRPTPGAAELTRALLMGGHVVALVSGGFTEIVEPLAAAHGIPHHRANALEVDAGRLTGRVRGEIVDRQVKERTLRELAAREGIDLAHTVAVGDGANDIDMVVAAGLGVAVNAKPALRDRADLVLDTTRLDVLVPVLGLTPVP